MATGIESLFGMGTPQKAQQDYISGLMVNPAGSDLYSQLISTMANAGAMAGYGGGRLLGGVTAGEVESKLVNDTLKEINAMGITKDSEKFTQLAKRFAAVGLNDKAQLAAQEALKSREKEVKIAKDESDLFNAEQKRMKDEAAFTGRVGMLNKLYADDPSVTQGDLVYGAMDDKTFEALVKAKEPQKPMDYGDAFESLSKEMFGKPYASLTQQEATKVNSEAEARSIKKIKAGVPQPLKDTSAVVGLTGDYSKQTEKPRNTLEQARRAQSFINEAAGGNSQAWEAARTTIAKAIGEDKLSNEDIRRTGNDPRLVQGAIDWINKKTVGVPTADIQRQLFTVAKMLEKDAETRINNIAKYNMEVARSAGVSGNLNVMFPGAEKPAGGVIDFNSLPKKGR